MKYSLLFVSMLLSGNLLAEAKNLTFYKDLTHYKEMKKVDLNEKVYITLSDTAVLDTFNVSLKHNEELLTPKSVEIHPKNEENIFKLNKNKKVFINEKEYTLIQNGKGFIKVRNPEGYVTFIPKHKIEEISFTNDVDSTSHIAQVVPYDNFKNVDMAFSYALGEMSWKPKYDVYLKEKGKLQFDYNIEINNESLNSFEDVQVIFMLEEISRYYDDFTSSKNGGLFDFEQHIIHSHYHYREENTRVYDSEGFDQFGFDRDGFNKEGYNASAISRNVVSSELYDGKRGFSFSNLVDVPAKSKTLYPFKNALEMNYEKENNLFVDKSMEKESVYVPSSEIEIKNETGITISEGVMRIFSGDKGYDSIVIKEFALQGNKGDEDLKVSLGENFSVKAKVMDVEKNKFKYHIQDSLSIAMLKNWSSYQSAWKIELDTITFNVTNEANEKSITLNNQMLVKEENLEKVLNILNKVNNESDSKERTEKVIEEIKELTSKEIELNLEKENEIKAHILTIQQERKSR